MKLTIIHQLILRGFVYQSPLLGSRLGVHFHFHLHLHLSSMRLHCRLSIRLQPLPCANRLMERCVKFLLHVADVATVQTGPVYRIYFPVEM